MRPSLGGDGKEETLLVGWTGVGGGGASAVQLHRPGSHPGIPAGSRGLGGVEGTSLANEASLVR